MATITAIKVFRNINTGNFALWSEWAEKNQFTLLFTSPEELHKSVHSVGARVKRATGQQWGDNNGYTVGMAKNDFAKYAKEYTVYMMRVTSSDIHKLRKLAGFQILSEKAVANYKYIIEYIAEEKVGDIADKLYNLDRYGIFSKVDGRSAEGRSLKSQLKFW